MAELAEKIAAELENIDSVLARIPEADALPDLSELELAGVAALIHSFYNGVDVQKRVAEEHGAAKGQTSRSGAAQVRAAKGQT
jgi:hypothetical protein